MPHPFIHNSMPFNIANDASFPHVSFVHPHHELDSRLPMASSMPRHTRSQWGTHSTAHKKKNKYAFKFKWTTAIINVKRCSPANYIYRKLEHFPFWIFSPPVTHAVLQQRQAASSIACNVIIIQHLFIYFFFCMPFSAIQNLLRATIKCRWLISLSIVHQHSRSRRREKKTYYAIIYLSLHCRKLTIFIGI